MGNEKGFKGQVGMIAIVLILMVFLVLAIFLSSTLQSQGLSERMNFYTNNLLLSFLKTDTGYTDQPQKCQTMADLLHCSIISPSWKCGDTSCGQEAITLADVYLSKTTEKSALDYYLVWGDKESGNKKLSSAPFKATNLIEKKNVKINVTLYIGKA